MSHLCKPSFEFSGNIMIATEKIHKVTFFQATLLIRSVSFAHCGITNHFKNQWLKSVSLYYNKPMTWMMISPHLLMCLQSAMGKSGSSVDLGWALAHI